MWRLKTPHKGEKYKTRFETNLFIIQGKYQGAVAIVDKIDTAIEDRLKVKHAQKKKTKTKKQKQKKKNESYNHEDNNYQWITLGAQTTYSISQLISV